MTAATATNKLSTVLDTLHAFNWGRISDIVEGRATLTEGITTAEELAEIFVNEATVLGVPYAGTVGEFLPVAKNLIGIAESFFPVAQGIVGSIQTSKTQNAPTIRTGR